MGLPAQPKCVNCTKVISAPTCAKCTNVKCPFQAHIPPLEVYNDLITVEVGEDGSQAQEFPVYCGLICFQSAYFNNLLNGGFKEAGTHKVSIKDASVETFKAVLLWLNVGRLPPQLSYRQTFEIYVFADMYIMPRIKNHAVQDCISRLYSEWKVPYRVDVDYLYDNTTGGAPMRKIIFDFYMANTDWKETGGFHQEFHRDFLVEMFECLRVDGEVPQKSESKLSWFNAMKDRICDYHDHKAPHSMKDIIPRHAMTGKPVQKRLPTQKRAEADKSRADLSKPEQLSS